MEREAHVTVEITSLLRRDLQPVVLEAYSPQMGILLAETAIELGHHVIVHVREESNDAVQPLRPELPRNV